MCVSGPLDEFMGIMNAYVSELKGHLVYTCTMYILCTYIKHNLLIGIRQGEGVG